MTAFTDVQLSFVAHGVVGGLDHATMRQDADLTQTRLLKIIEGGMTKHETAVYDKYMIRAKQRVALAQVKHRAETTRMVPKAYAVMELALESFEKNPQLAYQVARDVLKDSDAPIHEARAAIGNNPLTQINIGMEAKGAKALDTAINSIAQLTSQIAGNPLPPIGTPSKHISISEATELDTTAIELKDPEPTFQEGEPDES